MKTLPPSARARAENLAQPFDSMLAAFVQPVAVGGFEHQQITRGRRFGVGEERGVSGAEVPGKDDGPGRVLAFRNTEADPRIWPAWWKAKRTPFEIALFAIVEAPAQPVDGVCQASVSPALSWEKLMASFSMGSRRALVG